MPAAQDAVSASSVLDAAHAEFGSLTMRVVTLSAAVNERDGYIQELIKERDTLRKQLTAFMEGHPSTEGHHHHD